MPSIPEPEYRWLKMMFEYKILMGYKYQIEDELPTIEIEEIMDAVENNLRLQEYSPQKY
jgi:hypothetical protein